MSGQLPECFSIVRSSLETIAYAYLFETAKNQDHLLRLWMNRHTMHKEEKKEAMRNFGFYRCIKYLPAETRNVLGYLYETCIDLGAHPNLASIAFNIEPAIGNGSHMFLGAADEEYQLPGFLIAKSGLMIIEIVAELEPNSVKAKRISTLLDYSFRKTAALARSMKSTLSNPTSAEGAELPYDLFLREVNKAIEEENRKTRKVNSEARRKNTPKSESKHLTN